MKTHSLFFSPVASESVSLTTATSAGLPALRLMKIWFHNSLLLIWAPLFAQDPITLSPEAEAMEVPAVFQQSTRLALERTDLQVPPRQEGWALGPVSWVAADRNGLIYLLQRGDKADPVVVLNREGQMVRSWGKGSYTIPHAIRLDPQGNVWTTDAASSLVIKYSADGKKLMEIAVGGQPARRNNFCGTTDVAFGPNGRLFISDGYANARILEYTSDGKKVREWGSSGTGPGQFRLPHSIVADENGVIYVADRENGRIQRFTLDGHFLGEWPTLGKPYALKISNGSLWLATRNLPNLRSGCLMKVDRQTGKLVGYLEVAGVHGMEVLGNDEILVVAPGVPALATPQWFRLPQ